MWTGDKLRYSSDTFHTNWIKRAACFQHLFSPHKSTAAISNPLQIKDNFVIAAAGESFEYPPRTFPQVKKTTKKHAAEYAETHLVPD